MSADLLNAADIVDAVRAVLIGADGDAHTNGLPANWFAATRDSDEVPLADPGGLEHGDLSDYPVEDLHKILPCILVRCGQESAFAAGGDRGTITEAIVRVVHLRGFDQCRDANGDQETNQTRNRERYAKIILRTLLADQPNPRLGITNAAHARTDPTLTTTSTAARVLDCRWVSTDYGLGGTDDVAAIATIARQERMWAIAHDLSVRVEVY